MSVSFPLCLVKVFASLYLHVLGGSKTLMQLFITKALFGVDTMGRHDADNLRNVLPSQKIVPANLLARDNMGMVLLQTPS